MASEQEPRTLDLNAIRAWCNATPDGFGVTALAGQSIVNQVRALCAEVERLAAERDALAERIVTVDIDGRTIRFDKVAEAEAALDAVESENAYLRDALSVLCDACANGATTEAFMAARGLLDALGESQ